MHAHTQDLRSEIEQLDTNIDVPEFAAPPAMALERVTQFQQDQCQNDLPSATRAVLDFADQLTRAPATITLPDIEKLRKHGYSDEAIHDIVQVVAYFNYINRVAEGLGVQPETDMPPADSGR